MNRFLIKHPVVGWVSVESEAVIPSTDRAWRAKLDATIQEMKLKEKYSFKMEFEGEHYLAMILPGMEDHSERREGPHPSDYKHDRWHSYSTFFFPQNDREEAELKAESSKKEKQEIRLKFSA